MTNGIPARSVAPSATPHQSAAPTGQNEAMRVRPARVRPSSQWRLGTIPLAPIAQAVSQGLRALGQSITQRVARTLQSRDLAPGLSWTHGLSLVGEQDTPVRIHTRVQPDRTTSSATSSRPQHRDGFDEMAAPGQQDEAARDLGLPTRLAEVRDGKSAGSEGRSAYTLPQELDLTSLRKMPPDILEKLLSFSVKRQTAENLYFVIAAQHLLATDGVEGTRTDLASKMQGAFTGKDAPFALNLNGKNAKAVQLALSALAGGVVPADLDLVLQRACNNLLQSFGSDVYRPFLETQKK